MEDQAFTLLIANAFSTAQSLLNLCDGTSSVDRELAKFANDLNAFASVGSFVQRSLADTQIRPSRSLARIVRRVTDGTNTILSNLDQHITALNQRYGRVNAAMQQHRLLRIARSQVTTKEQLLLEFLGQGQIHLFRSQIIYATSTLSIIEAVLLHAKARPGQELNQLQLRNEQHIFSEQRRARAKVEEQEPLHRYPPVRALLWLEPLPQHPAAKGSLFDTLAREWTHRLSDPNRPSYSDTELRNHVDRLARDVAGLQQVQSHNLTVIEDLQSRLTEQEQKTIEANEIIGQLQVRCQDWEEFCDHQEEAISRLDVALTAQKEETRNMKNDCRLLARDNRKLNKDNQALHAEVDPLRDRIDQLVEENNRLVEEKRSLERDCMEVFTSKQVMQEHYEALKIRVSKADSDRESWMRHAERLKDKLAKQPTVGPTSFPIQTRRKSSRARSASSGSSGTYVGSESRGSSRERQSSIRRLLNFVG